MPRLISVGDSVALGTEDAFGVSVAGLEGGGHAVGVKVGFSGTVSEPNPEIIVHLVRADGTVVDLNAAQPGTGYGVEFKSPGGQQRSVLRRGHGA